jgi:hypothetical protein
VLPYPKHYLPDETPAAATVRKRTRNKGRHEVGERATDVKNDRRHATIPKVQIQSHAHECSKYDR